MKTSQSALFSSQTELRHFTMNFYNIYTHGNLCYESSALVVDGRGESLKLIPSLDSLSRAAGVINQ